MKKIVSIILFMVIVIGISAQDKEFRRIRVFESANIDSLLVFGEDTLNSTTKASLTDTVMATKEYVDSKAAGLDSIRYGSDYWSRVYLNGNVVDSTKIDSTYHSVYADTATVAIEAINSDTSDVSLNGVDSVYYNKVNYYFKTILNGVDKDSTIIDSTYHAVHSDTALVSLNVSAKAVYSITLPYSGSSSIASRVAAAVEGTDYPTGWNIGSSGYDFLVGHNLSRWLVNVTVFAKITGTERQQLFNTAAYNGITAFSNDSIKISSISTIAKDIVVYLTFE